MMMNRMMNDENAMSMGGGASPKELTYNPGVSDFATTQRQQNPTVVKSAQVELITICDKPEGVSFKRVSDIKEAA